MEEEIIVIESEEEQEIVIIENDIEYISPTTQEKTITPTKEVQNILPDDGIFALSKVTVEAVTNEIDSNIQPKNIKLGVNILGVDGNLEPDKPDQTKTITPTEETQTIKPDTGYELAEVTIEPIPSEYAKVEGTIDITANGSYDVTNYESANVNVKPTLQSKNVIPSKDEQIIIPDDTYDGLSNVIVESIPNEYIIPNGTLDISSNGEHNVNEYEKVNVNVTGGSTVTKGLVINSYDEDGFATDVSLVGMTEIPPYYLYYSMYENGNNKGFLSQAGANLHLSDEITKIGSNSFGYCSTLALTKLPDELTSIGGYAFQNCTNITLTKLPDELTSIGGYAFQNCTNITLTKLPDRITFIQAQTFSGCTNLALTELPSGLTEIGNNAFYNCKSLALTELPNGVVKIEAGVFYYNAMSEMTCYGDINSISTQAFYKCSNLEKIVFPNITKVPTLGNVNVFKDTPIAKGTGYIYVPNDLVDSFKTATNWSTYANQIKPINDNAEKIEAINNMKATLENKELILEYDDELLDVDFYIENGNLIVNNNETIVDFSINENKEMEAIY